MTESGWREELGRKEYVQVDKNIVYVKDQRIIGLVGTTDVETGHVNSLGLEVV